MDTDINMAASNSTSLLLIFIFFIIFSTFSSFSFADQLKSINGEKGQVGVGLMGRRGLKSFRETTNGGNVTFECSPSGPCVPCAYSEKNDENYRCSETGYRIPLKCVKAGGNLKEATSEKPQKGRSALENTYSEVGPRAESTEVLEFSSLKHRSLLDDSSLSEGREQSYVTYRSCIPPESEEKLSVLGFEGIIVGLLLLSGSAIYYRRKRTNVAPGVGLVRVPTNSRF